MGMISLESAWENFKKYGSVEQEQDMGLRDRHGELLPAGERNLYALILNWPGPSVLKRYSEG